MIILIAVSHRLHVVPINVDAGCRIGVRDALQHTATHCNTLRAAPFVVDVRCRLDQCMC